jgi:hypothetical protein
MADPDDAGMDAMKKEKLRAYEASLGGFELKAFEALEREFQEVLSKCIHRCVRILSFVC